MPETNCPMACLKGTSSFVSGSLRLILFCASLIFLLVQIIVALVLLASQKALVSSSFTQVPGFFTYLEALAILALAGLGSYASFYKHIEAMKLFSILAASYGVYQCLGITYETTAGDLSTLDVTFQQSMKNYTWGLKPWDPDYPQMNKFVDGVQALGCCGYDGFKDYDSTRPTNVSPSSLPISCCMKITNPEKSPEELCSVDKENYNREGCRPMLEALTKATIIGCLFYAFFIIFLAIIAFIVATHNSMIQQESSTSSSSIAII